MGSYLKKQKNEQIIILQFLHHTMFQIFKAQTNIGVSFSKSGQESNFSHFCRCGISFLWSFFA